MYSRATVRGGVSIEDATAVQTCIYKDVCVCVCVCKRRNQSSVSDDITTAADADAAAILRLHFTLKPFPFFINNDAPLPLVSFLSFLDEKVSNKMKQQIALLISSSDSHLHPSSTRQTDRDRQIKFQS